MISIYQSSNSSNRFVNGGYAVNSTYVCSPIAFDEDDTNIYDETDSNNIGYFIKNTYEPLVTSSLLGTTNVTLPTAEQIATADGQNFDQGILTLSNSWLLTTNYWTQTSDSIDYYVWRVIKWDGEEPMLSNDIVSDLNSGARPVITTLKTNIMPEEIDTMDSSYSLSIGDAVTAIDGSKWHVLEASDENTETVVLLSDYVLNTDGSYDTDCVINVDHFENCTEIVFDEDGTNTYDEEDSNNVGYFVKNTYAPLVTSTLSGTTNVTIATANQIAEADGQSFDGNSFIQLTNSYLLTSRYWTKSPKESSTTHIWIVDGISTEIMYVSVPYEAEEAGDVNRAYSVRPVITTPKTNLIAE